MKTKNSRNKVRCFILFICCIIIFPYAMLAQYTCSTAINLGTNFQAEIRGLTGEAWITFLSPSNVTGISVLPEHAAVATPSTVNDNIDTIQVYTGSSCSSLTSVYVYIRGTDPRVRFNYAFISGQNYFIRISNGCKCNDFYVLSLIAYGPSVCEGNCNLSCNGNFDLTSTALPINYYCTNMGYTGCWNTFFDVSNQFWDDMDNYAVPAYGGYQGSPDYFNCSSTPPANSWNFNMGIPTNFMGNQAAFNGCGYSGLFGFVVWSGFFNSPLATNNYGKYYREYVQQELCDSMIAGHKYKISFSTSLSDNSAYSTYLGVLFTKDTIWQPDPPAGFPGGFYGMYYNARTPQWETPTQNSNTSSWTTYSFIYVPDSNYKHMSIGNFRAPGTGNQTQLNTNLFIHNNGTSVDTLQSNYYYLDGISVLPVDSIRPNPDSLIICKGDTVRFKAMLGGPNPYVDYSWTSVPVDTSLTNWLNTWQILHPITNPLADTMIVVHPDTTTTYYITITDTLYHCVYKDTLYVQVAGITLDSIVGNNFKCDSLARYIAYSHPNDTNVVFTWYTLTGDTVYGNGNDTVTVNWAASQGVNSWLYLSTTDTIAGCTTLDSIFVNLCCIPGPGILIYNDSATSVFGINPLPVTATLNINGDFTVNENLTLLACHLNMGPQARIIVSGGSKLIFNKDTTWAGCCVMWDAIEGESVNDTIVATGSYFGDAIRGIVSNNGSVYKISKCIFNRNYVSITVNPYAGNHAGTVQQSIFTSNSIHNCPTVQGTLLSPYLGQWPLYGIYVTKVDSITIGNPAQAVLANRFTKLRYGIRTIKTNSKIYNNYFNAVNKDGLASKAIWSSGRFPTIIPFNLTQYTVNVGNASSALFYRNNFLNCPFGVFTDSAMSTIVRNNTFNQTYPSSQLSLNGTAIRVDHCTGVVRVIDIINDSIFNHQFGYFGNQNNNSNTRVWGNYIQRNQPGTLNCTGVYVINNGNNNGTVSVYLNTIHSVGVGVRFANVKNATANNNFIQVRPTAVSLFDVRGVWAVNCIKLKITNNQIIKDNFIGPPVTSQWVGGIYIANCASSVVTCNVIRKIGYGIKFDGSGSANSTVFNNEMSNTYTGIWLNLGAIISQQGNASLPQDNSWTGAVNRRLYTSGLSSLGTLGNLSPFYYRTPSAVYYPSPTTSSGSPSSAITIFPTTSNPSATICAYVQPPSSGHGQNGQIAKAQIQFPGNQTPGVWLSRESLYRLLLEDSTIAIGDTVLTNFKDSADLSNVGKFAAALKIQSDGSMNTLTTIANAYSMTNNIVPSSNVEQNYQTVEAIMLGHELNGGTFTAQEIITLQNIAMLCPFTDGNAVYIARGLLAPIDTTEYQDVCVDEESGERIAPLDELPDSSVFSFQLYPNPSDGNITAVYQLNENETGKLEIFTIAGSLVSYVALEPGQQVKTIELSQLEPGIYLYKVTIDGEMKLADRLIIIK